MPKNKTMRITGGKLVRRQFLVPPAVDEKTVRPTPDRVREAVFSMLFQDLKDALVVDLFAGSGGHGFEAISRGAKEVIFVEKDARNLAVIKDSANNLDVSFQCRFLLEDVIKFVQKAPSLNADIVFLDPPYALSLDESFFRALELHVKPNGLVIFRCFKKETPQKSEGFNVEKDRVYGGTRVFIMRRSLT